MNTRGLLGILATLILVVLISGLLGGMMGPGIVWGMGPGMMWGYGGSSAAPTGGWGGSLAMVLGMIAMLAFWAAVIVGVVLLARWALGQAPGATGASAADDPQAILRRRYAAGEIDQETYERMKRELGTSVPH